MVALNFSAFFATKVEEGLKSQTIRAKSRFYPGDQLQLYTGQRTKMCRKLGDAICEDITYVGLTERGITLGDRRRFPDDIDEFARLDGFDRFQSMWKWFSSRYQTDSFNGYVIRWRDFRPCFRRAAE
jgi:hypothetical protein